MCLPTIVSNNPALNSAVYLVCVNSVMNTLDMVDTEALSYSVTGKIGKRIKGFFKRVWKFIKGVAPTVAKIAPAVLPGPYGAAVAGIAGSIDTISNAVSATAVGGSRSVNSSG